MYVPCVDRRTALRESHHQKQLTIRGSTMDGGEQYSARLDSFVTMDHAVLLLERKCAICLHRSFPPVVQSNQLVSVSSRIRF